VAYGGMRRGGSVGFQNKYYFLCSKYKRFAGMYLLHFPWLGSLRGRQIFFAPLSEHGTGGGQVAHGSF